jgi:tetratricopeptide (TPR) repeat protein
MASRGVKGRSVIFHPRNLVILAAAAVLFVLRYKYNLSLLYFLIFFILPLAVFYLALPLLARSRFPAFERRIRILHMKGKWNEALSALKKNFFMRAFGPEADVKKLLGQTHAFLFKWESARRAFEQALAASGKSGDAALMAGYGEACFHTGHDGEAERALASFAKSSIPMPTAAYYTIHLMLEDEKKRRRARSEFEGLEWDEEKDKPVRLLTLAEIQAEEGDLDRAMATLDQVEPRGLPRPLRPMARLLEARILYLQEKQKEARKILDDLAKNTPPGRHVIELEDFER